MFLCIDFDFDFDLLGNQSKRDFVDAITNQGRSAVLIFGDSSEAISVWTRDNMLSQLLPFRVAADSTRFARAATRTQGSRYGPAAIRLTVDGETAASMQLASNRENNRTEWSDLPESFTGDSPFDLPTDRLRRSCRVLAELQRRDRPMSRRRPGITLHYSGAGQVLFHAFDQTWRWRFRQGNEDFGRYWIQTIRMLSRSKLSSETPATLSGPKGDVQEGDEIPFRVTLNQHRDEIDSERQREPFSLVVDSTQGKVAETPLTPSPTEPNRLTATLTPLPPGRYDVWLRSPSIEPRSVRYGLVVTALATEQSRLATDFDALETLATRTGGKAYTEKDADRLFRELPDPQSLQTERLPARPLWNSPWLAILVVGLLSVDWTIRRSSGLP